MVTSVGLSFPAAAAAMRANVAGFAEIPFHDRAGKPIVGAPVPLEAEGYLGSERLLRLLLPAIRECLGERGLSVAPKVPLILCLSEAQTPGRTRGLDTWLPHVLQRELGVNFHQQSGVIAEGRTGAVSALEIARSLLADRNVVGCLIAAVDSCINPDVLAAYDGARRLKTENNPDGIIPGEAASAVLVTASPPPPSRAWPVVQVAGIGFGQESVLPNTAEPILGLGLTSAVKAALAASSLAMTDIDLRLSDLTGERYGFQETNYALARVLRGRKEFLHLWHCMDTLGDTGAAAGTCMLARAVAAFAKGYDTGPNVLCQSSAESGRRAATVLKHLPRRDH